jgi:hypothetical protein
MSVSVNGGTEVRGGCSPADPGMVEVAALDEDIWKSSSCRDAEVYSMINLDVDSYLGKQRQSKAGLFIWLCCQKAGGVLDSRLCRKYTHHLLKNHLESIG